MDEFPHGGTIRKFAEKTGEPAGRIVDFSASINPVGPPEYLRKVISRSVSDLVHYPDPHGEELISVLSSKLETEKDQLLVGNGSTEIIYALPRALNCKRAIIPVPSYLDYERACKIAGLEVVKVELVPETNFTVDLPGLSELIQEGDLVFLGQPNNPTGMSFSAAELLKVVTAHPDCFFAVDESFFEFIGAGSDLISSSMPSNLIVLRSLTKFYAIPGLRLGFAAADRQTLSILQKHIMPWTVNTFALEVGKAVLVDDSYGNHSRVYINKRREELQRLLADIPLLNVFPGEANYLLIQLNKPGMSASLLADKLLSSSRHPIAIRNCDNFSGLDQRYFRIAVRNKEENELLCQALESELGSSGNFINKRIKHTPSLMFQGTASNAGKSVLTAAMCRILLQDGYSVAPFKAQNMSLNSFVTRDGKEMGRAQVVQAQACRLDPDVRMNPVLLKPSSDVGSQIIVNGRVIGNMNVPDYIRYKKMASEAVIEAYDSLAAQYDVIVLEGAGSPAEVNLKSHDIVNMNMARHARSPVLLVGDIDRGGVFASFIGTMEVMNEWERELIAGFLVNRFRGQASLLGDAFDYVRNFTGKPTLGTIPFVRDHGLPEEDSVSFKAGWYEKDKPGESHVTIAVIDLPHISNFTDFEPFLAEPDVHLLVIRTKEDLAAVQDDLAAVILPGSKNVMADISSLQQTGMADQIRQIARKSDIEIIGICGGFQMLGQKIEDPLRIESDGLDISALGLLEMATTLAEEKTLARQNGIHLATGHAVHGYEIHHGRTVSGCDAVLQMEDGSEEGALSGDGRIWGTYLHGIFDDDRFRREFIDSLRKKNNLEPLGTVVAMYDLEPAFERLADIVRESVDIDQIYKIMGVK